MPGLRQPIIRPTLAPSGEGTTNCLCFMAVVRTDGAMTVVRVGNALAERSRPCETANMIRIIAVAWTGTVAVLTTIVAIYMMTMPAADAVANVLLLIGAMLLFAVCAGLAAEGRPGRPRVISPYVHREPAGPVRRIPPKVTYGRPLTGRPGARPEHKTPPRSKTPSAGHSSAARSA